MQIIDSEYSGADERKQIQEEYNRRLVLRKKAKKKRARENAPE